ncbi:hypothetical protein F1D97_14255 [Cellulomonas palmilytica]|nr:hypothetical protein F1D97_14255 [Cellulomonas palmilytica]
MKVARPALIGLLVTIGLALSAPATGVDAEVPPPKKDRIRLNDQARAHYKYRQQERRAADPDEFLERWALSELCNVNSPVLEPAIEGGCPPSNGTVHLPGCEDAEPVMPLWYQSRPTLSAPWSAWEMVVGWSCPGDLLPGITAEDFRELTIVSPPAHRQPTSDETLVNKDLIVYTEQAEQRFRTTIFDFAIDVVATPTSYSWDFGDGSEPLVTTSPGAPYPSFELTHRFHDPLTTSVTLTTTWSSRFRVDDPYGTWQDVEGTAVPRGQQRGRQWPGSARQLECLRDATHAATCVRRCRPIFASSDVMWTLCPQIHGHKPPAMSVMGIFSPCVGPGQHSPCS